MLSIVIGILFLLQTKLKAIGVLFIIEGAIQIIKAIINCVQTLGKES